MWTEARPKRYNSPVPNDPVKLQSIDSNSALAKDRAADGDVEVTVSSILNDARQAPDDTRAWERFWRFYEPILKRYIARLKVNPNDSADILQELFLKLRQKLPAFSFDRSRGRFRGWLRTLTDRTVMDHFRAVAAQRKKDDQVAEYLVSVQAGLAETDPGDAERDRLWVQTVSVLVMQKIREQFGPRTVACFEESTLKRRKANEIAAELGIANVNNVYVYASRVLSRVEKLKAEYDGFELDDDESPELGDSDAAG